MGRNSFERDKKKYGRWCFQSETRSRNTVEEMMEAKDHKTECVSERMITATIKYQQRRIELASVYFSHAGYTDVHMEKMYKCT